MTDPVKPTPKKKAAKKATVSALPTASAFPTPLRSLGVEGTKMWERIWGLHSRWISPAIDIDHVTLLCESVDERAVLRLKVDVDQDWRDRVALRALDKQIVEMMGALGLNPTERTKLNVGEAPKGRLAELREQRAKSDK